MRTRSLRWLTAFGFLVAVPVAMYALAQKTAPSSAGNPAASSKWVSHADPAGYSVQMPAGWTPSFSRERGWVQLMGAQGENVVLWPVFIPAPLDARTALFIHMQLAVASPFMADWGAPQAIASNVLRSSAVDQNMVAVSVFTWIPTPKGTLAYFYVTAARESDYRLKQDDFARILQSFRIIGAPAEHAKTGAAKYVQFADATEAAYTLEVPVGWNTSGGVFRVNALDARPWVETVSPQADTRISIGDRDIPPFIEPMPNFPPGSWYAPYGFVQLVQPFTPGALFSRDYALNKIAQFCSHVEMMDVRDRPDRVREYQQTRPSSRGLVTVGDASFRCLQQGQPRIGWYAATTRHRSHPDRHVEGPGTVWICNRSRQRAGCRSHPGPHAGHISIQSGVDHGADPARRRHVANDQRGRRADCRGGGQAAAGPRRRRR